MNDRPTHLDDEGRARMVDVGGKAVTSREATARGRVRMRAETLARALAGDAPKGDVRAVAEVAGVMAGKRTSELIPLCHQLPLTNLVVEVTPDEANSALIVTARAKTDGKTGVEMEALTAVSVACLTLYDMLKGMDREMVIEDVKLIAKSGGASGDYKRSET
jgi:cyclic pyranopterin monophosphate synthase